MTWDFVSLEKIIRRAPLALRFVDHLYGTQVTEGLEVIAYRLDRSQAPAFQLAQSAQPRLATRSRMSGIYGFATLDGLQDYVLNRAPAEGFCAGGDPPNYGITVRDTLGRYLPLSLALCLPDPDPKENVLTVTLYSSAARLLPDTVGVVRADLVIENGGLPAAHAVVSVTVNAGSESELEYLTLADSRGMAAVFVPYPDASQSPESSPLDPDDRKSLFELSWPLTFSVYCAPDFLTALQQADGSPRPFTPPTLGSIFSQQGLGRVDIVLKPGQLAQQPTFTLRYRQELILKTEGNDSDGNPLSSLLIRPA